MSESLEPPSECIWSFDQILIAIFWNHIRGFPLLPEHKVDKYGKYFFPSVSMLNFWLSLINLYEIYYTNL